MIKSFVNPLNAELNPIYHLLALLGAHHILHISRIRVNVCVLLLHTRTASTIYSPVVKVSKMLMTSN